MCRNMFRVDDDDDDGKICSEGRKKRREISETNFFPTFHACYSIDHPRRGVIVKQESVYANRFVNLHRCFFFCFNSFCSKIEQIVWKIQPFTSKPEELASGVSCRPCRISRTKLARGKKCDDIIRTSKKSRAWKI